MNITGLVSTPNLALPKPMEAPHVITAECKTRPSRRSSLKSTSRSNLLATPGQDRAVTAAVLDAPELAANKVCCT